MTRHSPLVGIAGCHINVAVQRSTTTTTLSLALPSRQGIYTRYVKCIIFLTFKYLTVFTSLTWATRQWPLPRHPLPSPR